MVEVIVISLSLIMGVGITELTIQVLKWLEKYKEERRIKGEDGK